MPKIDGVEIHNAAEIVYNKWIATLGLQAARKAQIMLGRMLRKEKARRETLEGGTKRARNKTDKS